MLQRGQFLGDVFWGMRQPAAQHIKLDFDAEERLKDAVVEIAGDAAAFAFDGAYAQAAQQKQIFKWRAKMPDNAFEALEVLRKMRAPRVCQHEPADGFVIEIDRHAKHGAQAQLLPGLLREPGQFGKMLAVVAIPAKGGAQAVPWIPANAGFGIVEEKDLSLR